MAHLAKPEDIDDIHDVIDSKTEAIDALVDYSTVAIATARPEEGLDEYGSIKPPRPVKRHVVYHRRKEITCRAQTAVCIKRFCVYMLSYVGLTCIVVAYSILGGFVFVQLESSNEERVNKVALDIQNNFTSALELAFREMLAQQFNITNERAQASIADFIRQRLKAFQLRTYELVNKEGWSGGDDYGEVESNNTTVHNNKWTIAGGLLYSVTVITTIGYGSFTPKTVAGRAVTMVYALIGIPLTVLCISNIGRGLASLFRSLYGGTFCVECRQQFLHTVKITRAENIELEKVTEDADELASITDYTNHSHNNTEVPIIICLLLVVWYIVFGAILFTIWEKDWDYFVGAYFCFITLSTIGFGDIVPGFSHKDWDDEVKQVVCSLYLLIGLSTLAMCFDLMQQRAVALANRFGAFIGLVKK
ncbi:TWiK family of potassium channels protein 18-like [Dreissena polymorpha]|uniref:Potassium channel domain-containing protein n=1 Tax=Dreissena polymorpha TaxID=45954 RepID=A0A9D4MJ91_DREPO|nr:TWiK family of potassium channels protein 18-like [Dreissena polymorpha]KAH3876714.1 hypothetical protein DPMN_000563 [Dreissena polymorpha]